MGKRTFLIGAGFSKAVAGAPVMKEIWSSFEKIYNKEKNNYSSSNRAFWFQKLDNFIDNIEKLARKQLSKDSKKIKEGVRENLEYLFTLVDIHSLYSADFNFKNKNIEFEPYPVIPFKFTNRNDLEEIRKILLTFLYITFEEIEGKKLLDEFASIISKTDEIITFNYDLLIEKALWRKDIWSPLNGYVGVNEFANESDYKDLKEKKISDISLHKMHGSISWDIPEKTFDNKKIKINLENDKGQFHYENLSNIISRKPKFYQKNKKYQGKHLPPWILPSFVKPFDNKQIYEIWKSAFNKLNNTDELVIIGYSFRAEDTNGQLLLAALPKDCKIKLVDPDNNVKNRLENDLGYKVDEHYKSVKEYLNGFENSIYKLNK